MPESIQRHPGSPAVGERRRRTFARNEAFDRAMAEFAEAYADQSERDHAALADAARGGRVEVAADPKAA